MLEYCVVAIKRQITYKTHKRKYFVSTLSFYDGDGDDDDDGDDDASGDGDDGGGDGEGSGDDDADCKGSGDNSINKRQRIYKTSLTFIFKYFVNTLSVFVDHSGDGYCSGGNGSGDCSGDGDGSGDDSSGDSM